MAQEIKADDCELSNADIIANDSKMSERESMDTKMMLLNDNKAGMEGLDKETINKIIYEASKGSLYFENEQRKDAVLKARIENQQKHAREITHEQLEAGLAKADEMIESLERERDLSRTIVHIDMDAFYASVEILSRPHLRDVPMAVGSNHMLSTSNYAARRFGVRAGMPGFIARKLCSNLVILPLNFPEYKRYSSLFGKVLSEYDPDYSKMGLDEAYLDITDYLRERMKQMSTNGCNVNIGELELEVVNEMRQKIFELTNLTSSAGIAPNSMLAKVCSDINKPNGQFRIERTKEAVLAFIRDLPIRKISGIGKVCEQMLKSLDIHTCVQLLEKRALLHQLHSSISFEHYMRVGLGVGYGKVERDSERKSMSVERTFEDTSDLKQLTDICEQLCRNLVDDLSAENWATKTITLKIKETNFQVKTRAKTLASATQDYEMIFNTAMNLMKTEIKNSKGQLKLRLMGVRASSLVLASEIPKSKQMSLYDMFKKQQNHVDDSGGGDDDNLPSTSHLTSSSSSCNWRQIALTPEESSSLPSEKNDIVCLDDRSESGDTNDDLDNFPSSPVTELTCPVCCKHLPGKDEAAVNAHLDECLNMTYIRQVLDPSHRIDKDQEDFVTERVNRSPIKKASSTKDAKNEGQSSTHSWVSKQLSPLKGSKPKNSQKRKKPQMNPTLNKFFRTS